MVMKRFTRFVALLFLAVAFSACSTATITRLAYNNATIAYANLGPMLTWTVDDYVDLGGSREDWVRVRIDRVLAWHRAVELPRYRELLEAMLAKSAAPYRVEDIAAYQREVRTAYHRVLMQVIPDTAEFLASMDSADVAHLERKLVEDNRKYVKDSVRGTPDERQERRITRFIGHLESWVGKLEPEQLQLVANRYHGLRDLAEELMGERRYRQAEIVALARAHPPRAELEAALRRLMVETDSWRRPEYTAKLRERDAQMHALIADLSYTLSDRQRAALQNRIRRFLGDISTLTAST
jgi:hypothetical protein